MSALLNAVFFIITMAIAFGFQAYRDLTKSHPKPELDLKEYWGPGDANKYKEDTSIKPFTVSYPPEVIEKLTKQLEEAPTFIDPLEGTAFEYGYNSRNLADILEFWRFSYLKRWDERQAFLNKYPQFTTQIQGMKIHYIHAKPKADANTKVHKIILLHGWPGSVREFYDIIELLTTPSKKDNIAFEVIAPSLPGYGWSEGARKKGLGPLKIAVVMRNLMMRVGIDKFYVQGGDWGSVIGSHIATLFPENVIGYHSSNCGTMTPLASVKTFIASFYPSYFFKEEEEMLADWIYPFTPRFMFMLQESGYMHIQATKPDTIGVALQNNPAGLAAYIIEKFITWTNPDYRHSHNGEYEKYFSLDSVIDNVMIYYLTNSITTSVRIYKEFFGDEQSHNMGRVPVIPPTGCAFFRHELMHQPEFILREKFTNIIHKSYHEDGGHFSAMQLPKVLYREILQFVKKVE